MSAAQGPLGSQPQAAVRCTRGLKHKLVLCVLLSRRRAGCRTPLVTLFQQLILQLAQCCCCPITARHVSLPKLHADTGFRMQASTSPSTILPTAALHRHILPDQARAPHAAHQMRCAHCCKHSTPHPTPKHPLCPVRQLDPCCYCPEHHPAHPAVTCPTSACWPTPCLQSTPSTNCPKLGIHIHADSRCLSCCCCSWLQAVRCKLLLLRRG